jgi:hypothetical protein
VEMKNISVGKINLFINKINHVENFVARDMILPQSISNSSVAVVPLR